MFHDGKSLVYRYNVQIWKQIGIVSIWNSETDKVQSRIMQCIQINCNLIVSVRSSPGILYECQYPLNTKKFPLLLHNYNTSFDLTTQPGRRLT